MMKKGFNFLSPSAYVKYTGLPQADPHPKMTRLLDNTETRLKKTIRNSPIQHLEVISVLQRATVRLRGLLAFNHLHKDLMLYGTSVYGPTYASKRKVCRSYAVAPAKVKPAAASWVIHPNSRFCQVWSMVLLFLLLYVFLLTPWVIAFEEFEVGSSLFIVESTVDGLFLLDILITLNSAYYEQEELVVSRWRIFRNYLHGFLIIDLLAIFPFYLFEDLGASKSKSLVRLIRISKVARVLRASKLTKVLNHLLELEGMERVLKLLRSYSSVARLVTTGGVILLLAHFSACMWYFTARLDGFGPDTWVVRLGFVDASKGRLYLAALYWAFTILTTVGYGDIAAVTWSEMVLCVVWMLFGIGFYSFLVGTISTVLTSMDLSATRLQEKLDDIQQFVSQFQVPSDLEKAMMDEVVKKSLAAEFTSSTRRCSFLRRFSKPVCYLACMAMHDNAPSRVHFFRQQDAAFVNEVVPLLTAEVLGASAEVYCKGDVADCIYFVAGGRVAFVCGPKNTVFKLMVSGSYFGEIELLEGTRRAFSVFTYTRCELLRLPSVNCKRVFHAYPEVRSQVQALASLRKQSNQIAAHEIQDLIEAVEFTQEVTLEQLAGTQPRNQRRSYSASPVAPAQTKMQVPRASRYTEPPQRDAELVEMGLTVKQLADAFAKYENLVE